MYTGARDIISLRRDVKSKYEELEASLHSFIADLHTLFWEVEETPSRFLSCICTNSLHVCSCFIYLLSELFFAHILRFICRYVGNNVYLLVCFCAFLS